MIRIVKPTRRPRTDATSLDMRISPKQGIELTEEIYASVADTQKWIVTTLPDQLIVTQKQHAILNSYTEEMFGTSDRIYVTPFNVMEVIIDREIDIVPEVEGAIVEAEAMLEKPTEIVELNLEGDNHGRI